MTRVAFSCAWGLVMFLFFPIFGISTICKKMFWHVLHVVTHNLSQKYCLLHGNHINWVLQAIYLKLEKYGLFWPFYPYFRQFGRASPGSTTERDPRPTEGSWLMKNIVDIRSSFFNDILKNKRFIAWPRQASYLASWSNRNQPCLSRSMHVIICSIVRRLTRHSRMSNVCATPYLEFVSHSFK